MLLDDSCSFSNSPKGTPLLARLFMWLFIVPEEQQTISETARVLEKTYKI